MEEYKVLVEYKIKLEKVDINTIVEPGDRLFHIYINYRNAKRYKEIKEPYQYYLDNIQNMKDTKFLNKYDLLILKKKK